MRVESKAMSILERMIPLADDILGFLEAKVPEIARLSRDEAEAYWLATTTGDSKYESQYINIRRQLLQLLADKNDFKLLLSLKGNSELDPLQLRQLQILENMYRENQVEPELLAQLVQKETELESCFTNFRAIYRDKPVSDNEISELLQYETDSASRQAAWESSKQIGARVMDQVLEVVRLRNTIARSQGFAHYQEMALKLAEIDPDWLFKVLDELKQLTNEPFRLVKSAADDILKERYGTKTLMPWHYSDPFFQEAPNISNLNLDQYLAHQDLAKLATKYYRAIGLDVDSILQRSDLYERTGKNQHAYCTDIDRKGDVRILCNLRPNRYWMSTILHELGHAVYDTYHDENLPYLLRTPAHTLTTEAVAMLMERQLAYPAWWTKTAGIPATEIAPFAKDLYYELALGQLVFIRWGLVVVFFERELYSNPEQDLNKLWWDLVEELQLLTRPEDRNAPDWAAKIHIATAPVYYQNYILGALTASQLQAAADASSSLFSEAAPGLGTFLVEKVFKPGARYPWQEMIVRATGEELSPRHFAGQFILK